jgi:hypothetical protein
MIEINLIHDLDDINYTKYKAAKEWCEEEHNQAGVSNPEWWQFRTQINITDKLLTLLVMRWS